MEGIDNYFKFLKIPSRPPKPRSSGLTVVFDHSMAVQEARNMMETFGDVIDYVKYGDHPAMIARHTGEWMKEKIDIYHAHGVKVLPGGVTFEVAAVQNRVEEYMEKVKELGFDAVEVSDDVVPLFSAETRARYIKMAQRFGLEPLTEVGRKGPTEPLKPSELIPMILSDLENGSKEVTLENSDIVFLITNGIGLGPVEEIAKAVGLERMLFEIGPCDIWKQLAGELVKMFGSEVNLENVEPAHLRHIEGMRRSMHRFDNFSFISVREGRL